MEAATAPPEAEGTQAEDQREEAVFTSKCDNLRIVLKPARPRLNTATGEPEIEPGKTVEFTNGIYRAKDSEEAEALREHAANGGPDGFHELGKEPDAAAPDPAATVKQIVTKALKGDFDGITAIYMSERNTYSRPAVLAACETALEVAEGQEVPAAHPEPHHQVPRVRTGPETGANVPRATDETTEPVGPEAGLVAPESNATVSGPEATPNQAPPEGEPPSDKGPSWQPGQQS